MKKYTKPMTIYNINSINETVFLAGSGSKWEGSGCYLEAWECQQTPTTGFLQIRFGGEMTHAHLDDDFNVVPNTHGNKGQAWLFKLKKPVPGDVTKITFNGNVCEVSPDGYTVRCETVYGSGGWFQNTNAIDNIGLADILFEMSGTGWTLTEIQDYLSGTGDSIINDIKINDIKWRF